MKIKAKKEEKLPVQVERQERAAGQAARPSRLMSQHQLLEKSPPPPENGRCSVFDLPNDGLFLYIILKII